MANISYNNLQKINIIVHICKQYTLELRESAIFVRCLDPDPRRICLFNTTQTLSTVVEHKKVQHFADSIKYCNPFMAFFT
jgi:hypothetical protein